MIEFRTLGSIELGGLRPGAAEALSAQPKRLAVLAYLALAEPRSFHGRESIISVFWPDRPLARGRGSLRNAVHFLRKHLGKEVIASRGQELRVDPELLWCDAIALDELLADCRPRDAVELYRGDLLPGLGPSGSPRFSRWLERERDRVRQRASDALWALAEEEEAHRNPISAADYARRAAELSRDPERGVRRVMRLLARAGDGVAAVREYEAFARCWETELRVAPSPQTRSLAEAIRQSSTRGSDASAARDSSGETAVTHRPALLLGAEPGPLRELRGKIAALPFLLTSAGEEREHLSAGLTHGIIASLSRLSRLHVVARTSAERYERGAAERTLRPIAEELGVDTVLQGSLGLSGSRLAVAAQLVDARTGVPLWAQIYDRDRSELLGVEREIVLTILDVLGIELSPDEEARVARMPTSSPEAYDEYLKGRLRLSRRSKPDLEAAIRHFEAACAIDGGFALALAGAADAYLLLFTGAGIREAEVKVRAREAARAALRADPRLGEPYVTLAMIRGNADRDWYGAEADFRRAIELSPGHATAHHWYGAYLTFVLRRFDDGAAELELARELDPLSPIIHNDIGLALLHRGRAREAIRKFNEALALEPTFWRTHYDLGVATVLAGDPEGGVELLERAWRMGGYGADPSWAESAPATPADWRATLERKLVELEGGPRYRGTRGFEAALVSRLLGREDAALRWVREARDDGSISLVLQYFPAFEGLEAHPEFVALLEEEGLSVRG